VAERETNIKKGIVIATIDSHLLSFNCKAFLSLDFYGKKAMLAL
jgi:hypothetical protein